MEISAKLTTNNTRGINTAWDSHNLQVPGLSYNLWGFRAWDTLQDSTDNNSIDKVQSSLEWQEYFSQFQDTSDTLPCHIHLLVCLCIVDPHSRAPKKNTSHGNEVLPQDITHLIQRPCSQTSKSVPYPAGNRTTRRPPEHRKVTQTSVLRTYPVHQVWQNPFCKTQWKGEEDKADRKWGGKTTSGNGHAWSSSIPSGQWRTEENGRNWLWNHLWCPNDPRC